MDFLSQTPSPLLADILQHITTLEDLQAAISASPALYRVFRDQAPTIIDAVATNGLEPELHNVVYAIARIRNQPVPQSITTLDLLRQTYAANLGSPDRPVRLSVNTTPQVCFGLVATVVNINKLAVALLDEFLRRTSKLTPQHAVKRTINFSSGVYSRVPGSDPWPEGQAAAISPSAIERPPSWVENYRVQRALWLIQLGLEIRRRAPWLVRNPTDDPSSQDQGWVIGKVGSWLPLAMEINPVAKALEYHVPAKVMPGGHGTSTSNPRLISLTEMPRCVASSNLGPKPDEQPREDAIGIGWSQNRDAVKSISDGRRIILQLMRNRHVTLNLPFMQTIIYPGLIIWDRQRLCDLGLIDEPHDDCGAKKWWEKEDRRPQMSEDEIWFAWYSIG